MYNLKKFINENTTVSVLSKKKKKKVNLLNNLIYKLHQFG